MADVRTDRAPTVGSMHERFGGVDTPAAIAGMFTALGVLVFLSSLLAAWVGNLAHQINLLNPDGELQDFEVIAFIVLLVVVLVAFFFGGWAAGRMARTDGSINGIASAMWMLFVMVVLAAVGAFIGTEFNAFGRAGLPDWISQLDADDITLGAGLATIGLILAMFIASWVGGRAGETYHRDSADVVIRNSSSPPATTSP